MHTNPAQLAGQLQARTPHAKPGDASATWKPCTLDVLTTQAIAATVRTDGTSDLCDYHGVDIIALVEETLPYTRAQRSTMFGNGNFQRLASALFAYQRHFAPRNSWTLVETNRTNASLTWRCRQDEVPLVVDVISRTRQLALLNSSGRATPSLASVRDAGEGKVLRWIDLIDPRSSQLKFPTEPAVAWAVVDDPIHMRELAFLDASEHQQGWS